VKPTTRPGLLIVASVILLASPLTSARSAPTYTVNNLGQVTVNSNSNYEDSLSPALGQIAASSDINYLDALSLADQAAFRSGSFDQFAHPATITTPLYWSSFANYYSALMTTSNNLGLNVGSETADLSILGPKSEVAWTQASLLSSANAPAGSLYTASDAKFQHFYGSVAGVNDHNVLALNEYQYLTNSPLVPNPTPFLQGLTQPFGFPGVRLGSLGGTSGMANALNNANEVVGWSQLANGNQHAFVYSNGTMQDLNLEIPPISNIVLNNAVGIDGSGRIVALGVDPSGETYEFLLTPTAIPEPSVLAFSCLVLSAFFLRNWFQLRRS